MTSFAVVGPGRAGWSFWRALIARGWAPGPPPDPTSPRGRDDPVEDLAQYVDVVLLTVPDDAIAEVAASIEPGPAAVLHVSGATGLDALAPHRRRGSVHPLMSLPDPETGAQCLTGGAVFAVDGDPAAAMVVEALGGRAVRVPDDQRALYHATAAVAANHVVALCAQVERLAAEVGVPLEAYWDLMATSIANVRRSGALSSLTGPAARGDDSTLARHLDALPPHERPLYVALAAEAARLAGHPRPASLPGPTTAPHRDDGSSRPSLDDGTSKEGDGAMIVSSIAELRAVLDRHRADGRSVGFVPTMGYLHQGHASLMRAAAANDVVVASIFVNPLQFAPDEDLAAYPRDLERDTDVATQAGVDILFTPDVEDMYPQGAVLTSVSVAEISAPWEGASRPTHFAGVATVVAKLFSIVGPCRAYFGEKDYQQLAVITRMVADLSMPVEVIGCPIVREPDGLALSSRNVYLSPEERAAAVVLRRALDEGERLITAGERSTAAVDEAMAAVVAAEPRADLDYAAAVDAATLAQGPTLGDEIRLLIAARVGTTRLIDNAGVTVAPGGR
jgi:pantoate--beta-alanine ligase